MNKIKLLIKNILKLFFFVNNKIKIIDSIEIYWKTNF